MTNLETRSPGSRHGLGTIPTAILATLLALSFVAGAAAAPAAALRSGPDVAQISAPGGPLLSGTAGGADAGAGADAGTGTGTGHRHATGYLPPVPGVDPPSGVERHFDPPAEEWGAGHRGVDLTAAEGSPVLSPGPGVVTFAGQVARRGVVVVTHPDGLRSSLEPVAVSVPVGTAVTAGAAIGVVEGQTGGGGDGGTTPNHCAPRSCVHWGVRRGERYIDPLSLLDRPPIVLLPDH